MSRYIDAEILLDAMRHITLGETDVARSEMKIVHYICHMPHIDDVRENVRAHWIDMKPTGDSRFMCSRCKVKEEVPTIMGEPIVWDYCPNCGADMRGDKP